MRSVCCGTEHVVVLTSDGSLLSWGNNRFGQCGVGNNEVVGELTVGSLHPILCNITNHKARSALFAQKTQVKFSRATLESNRRLGTRDSDIRRTLSFGADQRTSRSLDVGMGSPRATSHWRLLESRSTDEGLRVDVGIMYLCCVFERKFQRFRSYGHCARVCALPIST